MTKFSRCCLQAVLFAALAAGTSAQTPTLLRDINTAPLATPSSTPTNGLAFGGWTYFSATRPNTGRELFRTGSAPGTTELFADLKPGTASSSPSNLTVFLGQLWFSADGSLWRSNGTTAGTVAVRAFATGPSELEVLGSELLFSAGDVWTDSELWKTDGTTAGTVRVADIHPGSSASGPRGVTAYQGAVYFGATNGVNGRELWRSDGTTAGTYMLRDINPGNGSSAPQVFATLNSGVFFFAQGANGNGELWTTDGTTAGTNVVREIRPGTAGSVGVTDQLAVVGGSLFFIANDGTHGQELWASDGTPAGTRMVLDVLPGNLGGSSEPLAGAGGTVFFSGSNPGTGRELWKSDGTAAGTQLVADINPGAASGLSVLFSARNKLALGSSLFFTATDGQTGLEPWISDGTTVTQLADLAPGADDSIADPLAVGPAGSRLFFSADDNGTLARELYATDGTPAGTQLWDDIYPIGEQTTGSDPTMFQDVFGRAFFIANDRTRLVGAGGFVAERSTPWITDGTTAGTSQVAPVFSQATSTAATLDGYWLFKAYSVGYGDEPWRSDGTAAGTAMIADLAPGTGNSRVHNYTVTGAKTMLVTAWVAGRLWHTDGFGVTPLTAHSQTGQIYNLVQLDGLVLFGSAQWFPPSGLWRSDGTPGGTYRVGYFDPYEIVAAEGRAFFSTIFPHELWHTDGTAAGTRRLKVFSNYIREITAVGPSVFFAAATSSAGDELWYSNGLPAGTRLVKDIIPGSAGSQPTSLAPFRGGVLFSAQTSATGRELWFSDGTAAGTVPVADLAPGSGSSSPSEIVAIGSRRAAFSADNGVTGRELWITDGTSAGTSPLGDLNPNGDSDPQDMTLSGGRVVFSADDGIHGREPWVFDPGATAQPIGLGCAVPGGLRPLLGSQDPVLGTTVEISARVLATSAAHVLLFGAPRAGLQWSGDCFLFLDPSTIAVLASTGPTGSNWGIPVPLPLIPVLDGVQAGLQVISALNSGAIEFSNSVVWTLGF